MASSTNSQRRGGIIEIIVDGRRYDAKGEFSFGLGLPKRKVWTGPDGVVQGYTEEPQPGFIEGAITDRSDISLKDLARTTNGTLVLTLANGKAIVLRRAAYTGDASGTTGEGEFSVRFEGGAEELASRAAVNQPDAGD